MTTGRINNALSRLTATPTPTLSRNSPEGITLAVVNWNHEYVLPRSVSSTLRAVRLLAEKGVPAEVLAVDDASRDGSTTLLRQLEALYFEQGMKALLLAKNGGPETARNAAIANARYRYIAFVDADNEILAENLHEFFRSITQTQAACVYGNLIRRGPGPDDLDLISNESFQTRMFAVNYIDTCALFDRHQIGDLGGQSNHLALTAHEDWELYLRLATNGRKIVFTPLVFGYYYVLGGSHLENNLDRQATHDKHAHMKRVFNQLGIREQQQLKTMHLRYHPEVGYI